MFMAFHPSVMAFDRPDHRIEGRRDESVHPSIVEFMAIVVNSHSQTSSRSAFADKRLAVTLSDLWRRNGTARQSFLMLPRVCPCRGRSDTTASRYLSVHVWQKNGDSSSVIAALGASAMRAQSNAEGEAEMLNSHESSIIGGVVDVIVSLQLIQLTANDSEDERVGPGDH
jgi:hypothetical protein